MTISNLTQRFAGKEVRDYERGQPVDSAADVVYRLSLDYDADTTMVTLLDEFLAEVDKSRLEALVIGAWEEPHENNPDGVIAALADRAADLPQLKAVFIGDITYEECEISWIIQGDYTRLLQAFPRLEQLHIRGSNSLTFPACTHAGLKRLVIECGGLPATVWQGLAGCSFPALEHLELWVGTSDYGFDADLDAVTAAVEKLRTPGLRYLGLRDAEMADAIAAWIAGQPWISQLAVLDLSLGTLGDEGAQALLNSPLVRRLPRVDLSHHYISDELQAQLRAAMPGVVLDDVQEEDDEYRYVAVGE
ncbi:STM4015 family protein [Ideonella sp. DXS29W]|uniref:STM4015 family protein n=1 Tax=Ideonella lacteola TaxID=2984193 RepID=A0ABU9BXU7_9BURK